MKVTKNWWSVVPVMMGLQDRAVMEFRNGLRFYYARGLFSVEHFLEQPYALTDVKQRVVVDVGAFTGDSAIFFAWKGAKKVYAFEPIPAAYGMAVDNIRLNAIENIEIFNEAIGYAEGELAIGKAQPVYRNFSTLGRLNIGVGVRIHVKLFESLVGEMRLKDAVLKMDCEGCEYDVLLNVGDESLLPFSQIILEYHHGSDQLLRRLSQAGYETRPLDSMGRLLKEPKQGLGLLYAKRVRSITRPNMS